jgi:GNAT superfamily N-acetyltransferase
MRPPTPARVRILPAPVPQTLDAPASWALRGAVALERRVLQAAWGYPDLAESLQACWVSARNTRYGRKVHLVAVDDAATTTTTTTTTTTSDGARAARPDPATVVGRVDVDLPTEHNGHLAEMGVMVDRAHRRRGIGRALAERGERIARAEGRRVLLTWSDHTVEPPEPGPDGPPVLRPPTGSGRIPDEPGATLAQRLGFGLEQAERHSVLDLPMDEELLTRLEVRARAAAGAAYRLVTWTGAAPDAWVEGYAELQTRMSTDAPSAGLAIEEDVWDAARIRDHEETQRASGHRLLVAAAEHVPTGTLAAFTVLLVRPGGGSDADAAFQDSTLVLREHRGRRLGLLVKTGNVRRVRASFPAARRIHTWNAEENEPMLAINAAMGFRPAGIRSIWQKHLA